VLTPLEVRDLFEVLRKLAAEGRAIAIVTHKLDEVLAIADEITVLRRGLVEASLTRGASADEIARAMVGGEPPAPIPPRAAPRDQIVLAVERLSVAGPTGRDAVFDASLTVRAGEVLGVAGVQGNGQRELVLALAGLAPSRGAIALGGERIDRLPARDRIARGVGHVPEDRHARGIIESMTLLENLRLGRHREAAPPGASLLRAADVRPDDPSLAAGALSGGNQQKLVVARELGRAPLRLLLCAEPTRGVDLGATRAIRARLAAAADGGAAILLVSSELAELRALADRIVVMLRGRIVATLDARDATDEALGPLMTGAAA
jgi:simple sugar transport system ATP-binding protein